MDQCAAKILTVLNNKNLSVTKLTVSDQHVNFLLDDGDVKSVLKLNLEPIHKNRLADVDENDSQAHLQFLQGYNWNLSSESGAEYSFYKLSAKDSSSGISNAAYSLFNKATHILKKRKFSYMSGKDATCSSRSSESLFNAELISPASDRQIARVMPGLGFVMIEETTEMYNTILKPHIDKIISSGSLGWLKNVVEGKKELERLLVNREEWILNIDTKWRTHPDPKTVPRKEWLNHQATRDLYCLGIVKIDNIYSLRDLRADHIPLLKEMIDIGSRTIEEVYGVKKDQLRIFVHYHPQFYHFHVHFTRLENEIGAVVERGHLLADIIQNLQLSSTYYYDKTMTYKLSRKDKLYKKLVVEHEDDAK